jgi:putative phage-type endonuclease
MKIIYCEQGTPEWHAARCGRVTASRVADVIAKIKTGWGASRYNYAAELVAEVLTGTVNMDGYVSPAMKRGTETENEARTIYSLMRDVEPQRVGFVIHPSIEMAGCSPDSLIGYDGMLEIKCPNTATHIDTLLGGSIDGRYVKQMQWQMACCERQWCDFISFDNRLPGDMQLHVRRVERDPAFIADLEREVRVFLGEVAKTVSDLRQRYQLSEAA